MGAFDPAGPAGSIALGFSANGQEQVLDSQNTCAYFPPRAMVVLGGGGGAAPARVPVRGKSSKRPCKIRTAGGPHMGPGLSDTLHVMCRYPAGPWRAPHGSSLSATSLAHGASDWRSIFLCGATAALAESVTARPKHTTTSGSTELC